MMVIGVSLAILIVVLIVMNIAGNEQGNQPAKLKVWGIETARSSKLLLDNFRIARPNIEIQYEQIDEASYDERLLEALALGEGPDVFLVDNHSLLKNKAKLAALNREDFGLIKLRELFPQVIEQDFVSAGKIYALPLYLDTLVLYYNKDFFDQAGIIYPPKTWPEFQQVIPLLKKSGFEKNIDRAGAAIGGSGGAIKRAADILGLLMLQNGTQMVAPDLSRATFAKDGKRGIGFQAFNFYLQFANPLSSYFTWNDNLGDEGVSFSQGKTAMIFGYKSDLENIKKKNPFLNIGVTKVPQVDEEKAISYARYLGFGVSKRSRYQTQAWDFVIFVSTNKELQRQYSIQEGKRPAALKSLIAEAIGDPEQEIFARQALIARSWVQVDGEKVDQIFSEAIRDANLDLRAADKILIQAEARVSEILRAAK